MEENENNWFNKSIEEVEKYFEVDKSKGLSNEQVEKLREK